MLIVDDSLHTRDLYSEFLTFRGLGVVSAPDGGSALVMARALRPDVIVMDLAMPGIDGITATRQLKADPADQRHPGGRSSPASDTARSSRARSRLAPTSS